MAAKTSKSSILSKLAKHKGSIAKHAGDETDYGSGGRLPPGIENGIAQLTQCKIGESEKNGELFFYASGTVVKPKAMPDGTPIEGLHTSVMRMLSDAKGKDGKVYRTADEQVEWVMNELRKLGADTSDFKGPEDLLTICEALQEQKPFFRFRTWQGKATEQYPDPRTNETWCGTKGLDDFSPDSDDGVVDNTGDGDEVPEEAAEEEGETAEEGSEVDIEALAQEAPNDAEAAEKLKQIAMDAGVSEEDFDNADWADVPGLIAAATDAPAEEEGGEAEEEVDFVALGEAAAGGDVEAMTALQEAGTERGLNEPDFDSWESFAEAIASTEIPGEEGEAEEEAPEIQKGDVYHYSPIDPKTKKPVKKPVECEVLSVDEKTETVQLKNLDTKAIYKGVPFSALNS